METRILDTGCWILVAGYRIPDTGYQNLENLILNSRPQINRDENSREFKIEN